MSNPWLNVPLADYEGHMSAPGVQQLAILSDLFAESVTLRKPASIAILGIAGGNGLDRLPDETVRIAGFDFNASYLDAVRMRFCHLRKLELHCLDLSRQTVETEPFDLVHAALIFEHAGIGTCLDNAIKLVAPGGGLSVVLQLAAPASGPSQFSSMQSVKSNFQLVDPEQFCETLRLRGFRLIHQISRAPFWLGILEMSGE
jgi:hypothetical protein